MDQAVTRSGGNRHKDRLGKGWGQAKTEMLLLAHLSDGGGRTAHIGNGQAWKWFFSQGYGVTQGQAGPEDGMLLFILCCLTSSIANVSIMKLAGFFV